MRRVISTATGLYLFFSISAFASFELVEKSGAIVYDKSANVETVQNQDCREDSHKGRQLQEKDRNKEYALYVCKGQEGWSEIPKPSFNPDPSSITVVTADDVERFDAGKTITSATENFQNVHVVRGHLFFTEEDLLDPNIEVKSITLEHSIDDGHTWKVLAFVTGWRGGEENLRHPQDPPPQPGLSVFLKPSSKPACFRMVIETSQGLDFKTDILVE